MKLAYFTDRDPENVNAWSGLIYNMYHSFVQAGIDVHNYGNLKSQAPKFFKLKRKIYRRIGKCNYVGDRDPLILRSFAKIIKQEVRDKGFDVIFSPSSIPIAALQSDVPKVFWTDATFASMLGFYESFSNLCPETIRNGHKQERLALENCSLAIYASDWAANFAVNYYNADPSKVKVVPFGANVECDRSIEDITSLVDEKMDFDPLRLLFVGRDWKRKGGSKALDVVRLLNQRGVNAELDIAGCIPEVDLPDYVKVHGFISKHTIEGRAKLDQLFTRAHFFILPSEAEAFGIVFAEASSFGLPSLASNVGGIPSAVRDSVNGKTFSLDSEAAEYCEYIMQTINSEEQYRSLALSSFQEYKNRLNWGVSGESVKNLIMEKIRV